MLVKQVAREVRGNLQKFRAHHPPTFIEGGGGGGGGSDGGRPLVHAGRKGVGGYGDYL